MTEVKISRLEQQHHSDVVTEKHNSTDVSIQGDVVGDEEEDALTGGDS